MTRIKSVSSQPPFVRLNSIKQYQKGPADFCRVLSFAVLLLKLKQPFLDVGLIERRGE